MKAMAATTLIQNQLYACNCKSHYSPPAFAHGATSSSESITTSFVTLRGARSAASTGSAWNSIGNKPISLSAEQSLPPRPFDDGSSSSSSIFGNVPRKSTPQLMGRSPRFAKVEGVGIVDEQASGSQRVRVGKAAPKVVIMVDPVEAKRLAAAEMKAIQARAKLKRRKEIEANNGGWAVLGLTAGIVIDGYTGKSILIQIAGYLDAVTDVLKPFIPS